MTKTPPPILVATPDLRADIRHGGDDRHFARDGDGDYGHLHGVRPRPGGSRFTGAVQLIGSIIGIPLALASGYSLYRSNFSPEASCQSLRAGIVSMLDKNADASTLRMLVHRDVVTFERDCGTYDPDAVAAFKNLLAAERTPVRRAEAPQKTEGIVPRPPAKAGTAPKDAAVRREAAVKPETKPEPVAAKPERGAAKTATQDRPRESGQDRKALDEAKAILQAPPAESAKTAGAASADAKPSASNGSVTPDGVRSEVKAAIPNVTPAEPRPADRKEANLGPVAVSPSRDAAQVDAAWIARVRDALRESAQGAQPAAAIEAPSVAAAPAAQAAAPMPPPIDVPDDARPAGDTTQSENRPPDHPVPPAPIPNVGPPPAAN